MGLGKDAREVEKYYKNHPERLKFPNKKELIEQEIEQELDKLRKEGIIIKTIKNQRVIY